MTSGVLAPTRPQVGSDRVGSDVWTSSFADDLPELAIPARGASTPVPRLVVGNRAVARELGLDPERLAAPEGVRLLTGERTPRGARPVAQVYAGHQWGLFKPRLGDGRAMLLGERRAADGRLHDVHLKGTGPTEMARGNDGFAGLGPMLREYLLGEAMHALGVPTTRGLAVVTTGVSHERDVPEPETILPGAVLARVATSHLRIGTFEYACGTGDVGLLRRVADHAIARCYPEAAAAEHPYRALLDRIVAAHARLTAHWMRLGFVHGVLSTDNVLISGETIDYGPCAFLDAYEPGRWYSSIDKHGRYAYERQPSIMAWNLARLGDAFAPLIAASEHVPATVAERLATGAVVRYEAHYESERIEAFRAKLGLPAAVPAERVRFLADDALELLAWAKVDFTGFFRDLAAAAEGDLDPVRSRFEEPAGIESWSREWLALEPDARRIRAVNPCYIPRNHLVEAALTAAGDGDLAPFRRLLDAVSAPYEGREGLEEYAQPDPDDGTEYRTYCGT